LLPAGSFTPTGAAIVAVLEIVPVPLAVAVSVKVAVPPTEEVDARADVRRCRSPGRLEPALAAQVHVAP
jgi:hypothetical protein